MQAFAQAKRMVEVNRSLLLRKVGCLGEKLASIERLKWDKSFSSISQQRRHRSVESVLGAVYWVRGTSFLSEPLAGTPRSGITAVSVNPRAVIVGYIIAHTFQCVGVANDVIGLR